MEVFPYELLFLSNPSNPFVQSFLIECVLICSYFTKPEKWDIFISCLLHRFVQLINTALSQVSSFWKRQKEMEGVFPNIQLRG